MSGSDTSALGKYRLIAELGRGGMAEVYLALVSGPAGFNKLVVVKRIRAALAEDPDFLSMFLDEARLAARLNHPNVIQTNEVGGEGRQLFIAMEYLEGQPLNRVVNRIGRAGGFTLALHLRVLIEALTGLHYAHELRDFDGTKLQVVHRDMTPHNVFVSYSGQVKVVDFGIAKAIGSSAETRAGVLKGKVAYMAPEQALGDPIDRRADIFSVGVMLWEALTAKRLFREDNDLTILQKIVTGQIPSPREVNPEVPALLDAICMKALSNNREERHTTAIELQADLEAALEEMGERPLLRDVGRLLTEQFDDEEAKIKALVEAQLSDLKAVSSGSLSGSSTSRLDSGPLTLPVLDGRNSEVGSTPEPSHSAKSSGAAIDQPAPTTRRSLVQTSPADASTPPRLGVWLVALAAIAIAAALSSAWIFTRSSPPPPLSSIAPPSGAHTLYIESTPPGARVSEGGAPLGKTPLALALDPTQVGPRQFIVSLEGYAPAMIHQGPSREEVRVVVPLLRAGDAAPSAATASTGGDPTLPPHGRGPTIPPHAPTASARPSADPLPLPINTTR